MFLLESNQIYGTRVADYRLSDTAASRAARCGKPMTHVMTPEFPLCLTRIPFERRILTIVRWLTHGGKALTVAKSRTNFGNGRSP